MRNPIFYVNCSLSGKQPEVVAKVCINEHGTCHGRDGEIGTLRDAVLRWRIRNCFFICDAVCFAVFIHLSMCEFRGVIYT